jgi:EamA domain-containing membrane protein RarD
MTIETLFIVLVPLYLVMIAYGVVGARRKGTPGRVRAAMAALIVLIPPLAVLYALWSTHDAFLIAGWGTVTIGMLASGIATAIFTEFIARRVGS